LKVVTPSPLPFGKMVTLAVPLELALTFIVHVVAVQEMMLAVQAPVLAMPAPSMQAPAPICVVSLNPVRVGEPLVRVTAWVMVCTAMSVA
jgi:hypothetical protein